jgi:hypothetical protein
MLSLTLFLALQLPNKPVDFEIFQKEVKIGTAKMFLKLTQTGGKKVESKMVIQSANGETKVSSAQEWDFEGVPLLKTMQVFGPDGVELRRQRIDFKDGVAKVKNVLNGQEDTVEVAAPEDGDLSDLAEFWLVRDEPEPKQRAEILTFDTKTFKWVSTELRYMGEQVKTFGTKKVTLHHIRRKTEARTDDIWSEGNGMPYYTESSDGTVLKRVETD